MAKQVARTHSGTRSNRRSEALKATSFLVLHTSEPEGSFKYEFRQDPDTTSLYQGVERLFSKNENIRTKLGTRWETFIKDRGSVFVVGAVPASIEFYDSP